MAVRLGAAGLGWRCATQEEKLKCIKRQDKKRFQKPSLRGESHDESNHEKDITRC
jgi:hypothetical protein